MHGSNFSRYNFKLNNETRKRFDSSSICNGCLLNNNFNFRNKVKKEIEIMTPKEKAKEFVERFNEHIEYDTNFKDETIKAKKRALICVDEILRIFNFTDVKYWQEVKKQLEKL